MLSTPILGDLIREAGTTLRQIIPDPKARAELEYKLAELADRAEARETALLVGQIEVNKEEAKNANLFVAGWRPAIGWVGATALGWTWVGAPIGQWVFRWFGIETPLPALDPDSIYPIILGMLGLGTMRSFEKTWGVATSVGGVVHQPVKPQEVKQKPAWLR